MSRAATQEERWDRDRDYRKHDAPPDRLTPAISETLEMAILIKAIDNPQVGADLIEQYGSTREAAGRLDGVTKTLDRIAPVRP